MDESYCLQYAESHYITCTVAAFFNILRKRFPLSNICKIIQRWCDLVIAECNNIFCNIIILSCLDCSGEDATEESERPKPDIYEEHFAKKYKVFRLFKCKQWIL